MHCQVQTTPGLKEYFTFPDIRSFIYDRYKQSGNWFHRVYCRELMHQLVYRASPTMHLVDYKIETAKPCAVAVKIAFCVQCYASIWLGSVSRWRNETSQYKILNWTKALICECTIPPLVVTAVVETVAYSALHLGTKALSYVTNQINPGYFYLLRNSAAFTIYWSIATLALNIFKAELVPDEDRARRGLLK